MAQWAMPPKTSPGGKRIGRPPRNIPPRKVTSVRLELDLIAWMNENLPRTVAVSDVVNEALHDWIARRRKKRQTAAPA